MNIVTTIGIVCIALASLMGVTICISSFDHKGNINRTFGLMMSILLVMGASLILITSTKPRLDRYYEKENPASWEDIAPEAYEEGFCKGRASGLVEATELYHKGYNEGFEKAYDNIETWFGEMQNVTVTISGEEATIHIVDGNGEQWVITSDTIKEAEPYEAIRDRLVPIEDK